MLGARGSVANIDIEVSIEQVHAGGGRLGGAPQPSAEGVVSRIEAAERDSSPFRGPGAGGRVATTVPAGPPGDEGVRAVDEDVPAARQGPGSAAEDDGLSFDSPGLQNLMDRFQELSGLANAVIDLKGKVLIASGWQEICIRFHRVHPEACRHCVESDIYLSANLNQGRYALYRCKNGLWDMATPVVVDGRHVANVFSGQFLLEGEPFDLAAFERQAERYGFDRESYLAALGKVPRVTRARARQVMESYLALAQVLVELGQGTKARRDAIRAEARAEAQRRIGLVRAQLAAIIESSSDAIMSNDLDGFITTWNRGAERIYGYTAPEILGRNVDVLAPPLRREESRQLIDRVRRGEYVSPFETVRIRKDGTPFEVSLAISPIRDAQGVLIGVSTIARDVTEHKRTEREVRAASLYARSLIEASLDPLVTISPAGKITDVNRATEEATGVPRRDLIGTDFADYFSEPDRARAGYQQVLQQGLVRDYPLTLKQRSGKLIDVLYNASVYRNEAGDLQGVFAAARDVTEHKQMEEALRSSADSLREAQRFAHLGNWEYDLRTGAVLWSEETFRIFEIDRTESGASYSAFLDTVHPEDRDLVAKAYADSVASRTRYDIVHRLLMKDGRVKYVNEQGETTYDDEGQPLRSIGTVQDVTERKRAELEAQRERDRVNTIMEASPVAMVRVVKDGRIDFANAAAAKLLGFRRDAIEQLTYNAPEWGITDWDGGPFPEDQLPFAQVMRTGQPVSANHAITWPDGRRVLLSIRGAPLLDSAGKVEGAVFGIEDATDRRRMEDQLRQAQKLEAVGRLAGGVAHDFNNLLTAILSGSDELLEKLREPDPLREEASLIHEAAFRAAALTRQLLIFSRKQVVQPRVIDLWGVVTSLERMLRRLIGEDVELKTAGVPGGLVKVDPGQMEQVIVNLAVNARDAMPRGGRLTIETSVQDLAEDAVGRHVALAPGRYVLLAVSDTGCGMTPEVQSHLFEPFFTTKEAGKGTGLGLSTVYGIVTQAGGHVWAYSEPGKGSAFKVYLPLVGEEAPAATGDEAGSAVHGTETVLVVEDEPVVRRLVVRVLGSAGYTVLEASDGVEALEVAAAAGDIAALVTDTVMPRMGGEELAAELRRTRPGIRVLFMSGYTEQSFTLEQEIDEGSTFLQKPFTATGLARRVRELIDRRVGGTR